MINQLAIAWNNFKGNSVICRCTPGAHLGHTWGTISGTPGAHLGHTTGTKHTWGTSRAQPPGAHLGHTSGTSRAHLGHNLGHNHLGHTSGTPRAHLGHISGTSRAQPPGAHLGHISGTTTWGTVIRAIWIITGLLLLWYYLLLYDDR